MEAISGSVRKLIFLLFFHTYIMFQSDLGQPLLHFPIDGKEPASLQELPVLIILALRFNGTRVVFLTATSFCFALKNSNSCLLHSGFMDRKYYSHRNDNDDEALVRKVLFQRWPACWSIAPTRQLEALLRKEEILVGDDGLSIQEVIDLMPRGALKRRRLKEMEAMIDVLKEGTILESENPLTFRFAKKSKEAATHVHRYKADVTLHKYEDAKYEDDKYDFDKELKKSIKNSPTAARLIVVTKDYKNIKGRSVYLPAESADEDSGHLLLLTGYGTDANGVKFWEAQDSYGLSKGERGFIRIARGENLISDFFEMKIRH